MHFAWREHRSGQMRKMHSIRSINQPRRPGWRDALVAGKAVPNRIASRKVSGQAEAAWKCSGEVPFVRRGAEQGLPTWAQ